jgi:anti-sigma regulatory factor (Ser/Thr protein kinase)
LRLSSPADAFEFRAMLTRLDEGLDALHDSVQRLRESTGRGPDDRNLMLFESALAEIGSDVLTHGLPPGLDAPVEYTLTLERQSAVASFVDRGAPVEDALNHQMPGPDSESGRGIALAKKLLDELGYRRDAGANRWRLVKRL